MAFIKKHIILLLLALFFITNIVAFVKRIQFDRGIKSVYFHVPYITNSVIRKNIPNNPKEYIDKTGFARVFLLSRYENKTFHSFISSINKELFNLIKTNKFNKKQSYISILTVNKNDKKKHYTNSIIKLNFLPLDIKREVFFKNIRKTEILATQTGYVDVNFYNKNLGLMTVESLNIVDILQEKGLPFGPFIKFVAQKNAKFENKKIKSSSFNRLDDLEDNLFFLDRKAGNYNLNHPYEKRVKKAIKSLTSFRDKKVKASDVFDVKKTAKLMAISKIWGLSNFIDEDKLLFYLNPYTRKIEPVLAYDRIDYFKGFSNEKKQLFELLLRDEKIKKQYKKELIKNAKKTDVNKIKKQALSLVLSLKKKDVSLGFLEEIKERKDEILSKKNNNDKTKTSFDYKSLLKKHKFLRFDKKNKVFYFEKKNIIIKENLVIPRGSKLVISSGSRVLFYPDKGILCYGALEIGEDEGKKVFLDSFIKRRPKIKNIREEIVDKLKTPNSIYNYTKNAFLTLSHNYSRPEILGVLKPYMGRYEFVEDFNFRYYLKYENLFQGYLIEKSIRQEAKHLIDFNLASFLRNKAFEKIYPFYKNTWAGIAIVSSNQKSFIKNTRIKNAKGFYFGENVPSGAILAYQSNIEISNTDLDNIFASSAVRLISSRGKIKNISLHKILGDGIFSSNSSLELKDSNFSYIADDGLFLSKSKFLGEGLEFKLYGDCGVFAIDKTKAKLEKSSLKGGLCGALISKNTSYEEKNIKYQKNRLFDKKLDYEFLSEVDKFTR